MKYRFIEAHKDRFQTSLMCRVLKVSRSGFHAWQDRPLSQHAQDDQRLAEQIAEIHQGNRKVYGSPRVYAVLREKGVRCGRKRVERLMREKGLAAKQRRRGVRTTDSAHGRPIAQNILNRQFGVQEITASNRVWTSDITYVETAQGWLYLAAVEDLFSRRVVGWSFSDSLEQGLVTKALQMALKGRKPDPGLLHHSDRGSQYAGGAYQELLAGEQMICSMSRRGNCWDNAPMESFFATLKTELIHQRRFKTRENAKAAIFEYIEVFYNRQRRHSALGYLSPAEYERRAEQELLKAA